ncbi:MAG: lipid carrier--UDP-N-acetylgalactosaminyltransferase [Flammeovirgaceae bacterium]|nr:lipid carrier--UDP-N-acetylgalactosaminyltransferase [Flammeovirgaceae bacterium]|tara:strand:- start:19 stop:570 length:552 start_codon:yes stop_codon:yes gene_type:complete
MSRIIALLLILLILPLYCLIAFIVYISDGLPVFYVQKKLGLNHKEFNLYKFRTMKKNTPELPTEKMNNSSKYIIKFGPFLRKFSLDELPQFFNVLKGDMNFVGPRPCMSSNEEIVKKLREEKKIYKIKPGITGWAQVNGRDLNSFENKVELDYYYLLNKSLWLNFKIILKTFFVVLVQRNIKH